MPDVVRLESVQQFRDALTSARKLKKLTQGQLCARMETSQQVLSRMEAYPGDISFSRGLAWAHTLGLDLWLGAQPTQWVPSSAQKDATARLDLLSGPTLQQLAVLEQITDAMRCQNRTRETPSNK